MVLAYSVKLWIMGFLICN